MTWARLRSKALELISYSRFGLIIIGFVIILRLSGSLQLLELLTLDRLQQTKIGDVPDSHITLIGIDEDYLVNKEQESLRYADITEILGQILPYQPAIVGVDIVKDDLNGVGEQELVSLFNSNKQLFTIETVRNPIVLPLEGLEEEVLVNRVGFNDFSLDIDGKIRRMFLGWTPADSRFRESFALMLAKHYLQNVHGKEIENGDRDVNTMRFDDVEIPRLNRSSGGYRSEKSIYGVQTLINFRNGFHFFKREENPFKIVLASDLVQNKINSDDITEKIIIIGTINPRDAVMFASAIPSQLASGDQSELTGIELQAHATSQVISAVLYNRHLVHSLHLSWEHALILIFGLVGIGFKGTYKTTISNFFLLALGNFVVIAASYLCFLQTGLWLPIVPILLALTINGFIYTAVAQSVEAAQSEQRWRALIEERDRALTDVKLERQKTVEQAFDTIHNGPLQTLANLLRLIRDKQIDRYNIGLELQKLNREIRDIGEALRQESLGDKMRYVQVGQSKLDLSRPMHDLFYEVYRETMQRPFPGFEALRVQVRSFEPVEPERITDEYKQKLCRFLEEALCNVGRHATGATKLTVTGKTKENSYHLRIVDNGIGTKIYSRLPGVGQGRGTTIGYELEAGLQGGFTRRNIYPNGFLCEFEWPLYKSS